MQFEDSIQSKMTACDHLYMHIVVVSIFYPNTIKPPYISCRIWKSNTTQHYAHTWALDWCMGIPVLGCWGNNNSPALLCVCHACMRVCACVLNGYLWYVCTLVLGSIEIWIVDINNKKYGYCEYFIIGSGLIWSGMLPKKPDNAVWYK